VGAQVEFSTAETKQLAYMSISHQGTESLAD
jgi:hypothetical protein